MKAIEIQKQLNNILASKRPNYLKAFNLYIKMNDQRIVEGLPFLKLPNLEKRIAQLPLETIFQNAINN